MDITFNTKTLPPSIQIPKFIKILAQFLQVISYKLTAKRALKLFITPFKYPIPNREKIMFKSAQKKILKVTDIEKDIQILSYGYSQKKVLLIHGWAGRSTQLFMAADKLLENGYMVISFDGPAHGKSTGKTTNLIEHIKTIIAINKEFGPFHAAIGHSFGAMALLNTAAKNTLFKKIVTVGAGDLVSNIIKRFVKNLTLKPIIATKMIDLFEKKWNISIDNFASSNVAKSIKTPVLVIHDTNDGDVPVSCAYRIRQNLQNGSLLITQGLGHTKILRDTKTINRIVNFIIE